MKKLVISMLLTGLVFCVTAIAEPAPKIGAEAPSLELSSLAGQTVNLQKYFNKNKKVILTFFTSWSKPCQEELDQLQALAKEHKTGLEILAVSFDKKSKELKSFAAGADYSFPILHDKKLSLIDNFQILIIPTTFCINPDGTIAKIFIDYDNNVKEAIEDWLSTKKAAGAKDG